MELGLANETRKQVIPDLSLERARGLGNVWAIMGQSRYPHIASRGSLGTCVVYLRPGAPPEPRAEFLPEAHPKRGTGGSYADPARRRRQWYWRRSHVLYKIGAKANETKRSVGPTAPPRRAEVPRDSGTSTLCAEALASPARGTDAARHQGRVDLGVCTGGCLSTARGTAEAQPLQVAVDLGTR